MKILNLQEVEHNVKVNDICPYIEPNIVEDTIFYADSKPIGFYMTQMPENMTKLANLANAEFLSKNVPKTVLKRVSGVDQYSTILGSVAPNARMRRSYPTISRVHSHKPALTFIKSMVMLAKESEQLIKEILPDVYSEQVELFKRVKQDWRFGNIFTSSISNYNISVSYHKDTGNIVGALNVIICKKLNSIGGDLNIPDYNATIGQQDNSILVFPAWRNMHGVTPITPTHEGGYRNSLVFYPLKAFMDI